MVQSENGYFEGVNTLDESTGRVFGAIKNEKRGKKGKFFVSFGRRTLLDNGSIRLTVLPKSHRKGGRITI